MVLIRECCCGLSLKTGALIVVNIILAENLLSFLTLVTNAGDISPAKSLISTRHENNSARFFDIWTSVCILLIDCVAVYGIYKHKAPLLVPFVAYRTANLIFLLVTLLNTKKISEALTDQIRKQIEDEDSDKEVPDLFPAVLVAIIFMIALELYFIIVTYSYYQILSQNSRIVSVNVPMVPYTVQPHDHLNMYAQPPVNPYLFQAPKYPYQFESSKYAYNPNPVMHPDHLPPPYGS